MKFFLTTVLSLVLFVFTNCGTTNREDNTSQKIANYLFELEKAGFYGAVLVELPGEPILSKGYGFSNKARQMRN